MIMSGLLADINGGMNAGNMVPANSTAGDTLFFLVAFLLGTLIFLASTFFFRPRPYQRPAHKFQSKPAPNLDTGFVSRKRTASYSHRRHQRRSPVFPLNPTLAQIGGLPPIRSRDRSASPA